MRYLLAAAAALCIACALDAFVVEPSWIEVRTVRLSSPKIAPGGTVRLVQLSDLHSERAPFNEPEAARLVAALKPDLIAVTGDYVNETEGAPAARALLSALALEAPVFVTAGNYDLAVPVPGLFDGLPVRRLRLSSDTVDVRGSRLRLSGLDVGDGPKFRRFAAARPKDGAYEVLLHHYSDLAYEAAEAGVDLYLSGHTHGGQVRLPFYGALVTLATFGKRFEEGLYRVGPTALYVNRGLGMEGGDAPKVRFLCRPEITLFEISHGEDNG